MGLVSKYYSLFYQPEKRTCHVLMSVRNLIVPFNLFKKLAVSDIWTIKMRIIIIIKRKSLLFAGLLVHELESIFSYETISHYTSKLNCLPVQYNSILKSTMSKSGVLVPSPHECFVSYSKKIKKLKEIYQRRPCNILTLYVMIDVAAKMTSLQGE